MAQHHTPKPNTYTPVYAYLAVLAATAVAGVVLHPALLAFAAFGVLLVPALL